VPVGNEYYITQEVEEIESDASNIVDIIQPEQL